MDVNNYDFLLVSKQNAVFQNLSARHIVLHYDILERIAVKVDICLVELMIESFHLGRKELLLDQMWKLFAHVDNP